jgi:hypothetical protein
MINSVSLTRKKNGHEDVWEIAGIPPPFLTSTLDGVEWLAARPDCFIPGETPRYRRLGRRQSRSGRCGVEKNLFPLPEFETRPSSL